MSISYLLAPIPKWVIINTNGTVAGGAKLYTYSSLDKITQKPVYQDVGGTLAWTNPILFDLNGTQGPFYWEVDSGDLQDTYYLEAYDSNDNLLWTIDNYFPPGSGGGGDVTTYLPLTNYIANNVFIDAISDTGNPVNSTNLVVAPSNHQGFTPALLNPVVTSYGVVGPDIRFVKNNTAATDEISFPLFPLASAPLTGDVTPVYYCRYQCTNSPAGETYKSFQFPVCQKVKNLSNQVMTFQIWAAVTATPVTLSIYTLQYYGSGTGATAPVQTLLDTITLTTTWTPYNFSFTVPNVSGNSIGTVGMQTNDDALYIQVGMPLGAPCDVLFTKPSLYLNDLTAGGVLEEFETYDQINSINSTFRTGDIKTSLSSSAPLGWVPMNDGSIGNVNSAATTRANVDTFQLYKTIWDGVTNTYATLQNSSGTPISRGASAIADFVASNRLVLPLSLGRALAGAGSGSGLSSRALGSYAGAETVALTSANLPVGTPFNTSGSGNSSAATGGSFNVPSNNSQGFTQGSGTAISIVQPTSFFNVFIKL